MKITKGRVVSGKVVIEGGPFPEGSRVTVIGCEDDETFELSPQDEAEILAAVAETERSEMISAHELITSLGKPA